MVQLVLSVAPVKALDQAPTHFSPFSDDDFVVAAARMAVGPRELFFLCQKLLGVKTPRSCRFICFGAVGTWGCLLKTPFCQRCCQSCQVRGGFGGCSLLLACRYLLWQRGCSDATEEAGGQ